jgi:hypothetical protein
MSLDELRKWARDKNPMPGGWFDERHNYRIVDDRPVMIIVEARK